MGGDEGGGREKLVLSPSSGVDLHFRVLGSSGLNGTEADGLIGGRTPTCRGESRCDWWIPLLIESDHSIMNVVLLIH